MCRGCGCSKVEPSDSVAAAKAKIEAAVAARTEASDLAFDVVSNEGT